MTQETQENFPYIQSKTQEENIKFAKHLRITQVYLNDASVNILIQDKKYMELLDNLTKTCVSLQEMAIIVSNWTIQHSFSEVTSQIKKDINEITGISSKVQ